VQADPVFTDMKSDRSPETPAIRFLERHGVAYSAHFYAYEEHGGTRVSARELKVDEHAVVKTLVMEDESERPLIVLMHGDRTVSTRELARQIGRKRVEPCKPEVARRHSGFLVGGTSPFGTRKKMPVYVEKTILDLPLIYINGGRRGFLVGIDPRELVRVLAPGVVEVASR
jgi:Cys-tRNA(Pro) deacylase